MNSLSGEVVTMMEEVEEEEEEVEAVITEVKLFFEKC